MYLHKSIHISACLYILHTWAHTWHTHTYAHRWHTRRHQSHADSQTLTHAPSHVCFFSASLYTIFTLSQRNPLLSGGLGDWKQERWEGFHMELLISKIVTPNIKRLAMSGKASSHLRRGGSGLLFIAGGSKETWRVPIQAGDAAFASEKHLPHTEPWVSNEMAQCDRTPCEWQRVWQRPASAPLLHLLLHVHGEVEPVEQQEQGEAHWWMAPRWCCQPPSLGSPEVPKYTGGGAGPWGPEWTVDPQRFEARERVHRELRHRS